eukprot:scaffold14838_cov129-Cylindrotheca_fusiformis.AAC.4
MISGRGGIPLDFRSQWNRCDNDEVGGRVIVASLCSKEKRGAAPPPSTIPSRLWIERHADALHSGGFT